MVIIKDTGSKKVNCWRNNKQKRLLYATKEAKTVIIDDTRRKNSNYWAYFV